MRFDKNARLIFYPNPKCGSTSIRHFFDTYFCQTIVEPPNDRVRDEHSQISVWHDICVKNPEIKDSFIKSFSFTTIRNPWERIVSLYRYSKTNTDLLPFWDHDYDIKKSKLPFNPWFDKVWLPYHHNEVITVLPIKKYAYNSKNECLVHKIYPIETFSLETMIKDYENHTQLKFECKDVATLKTLEKLNVSPTKYNYREFFDSYRRDVVHDLFQDDIQIGNYKF